MTALVVALAALPALVYAADGSVSVTVSYFNAADGGFPIARQTISVAPDLSERYGLADDFNGNSATVLDAMVAMDLLLNPSDTDASDISNHVAVSGGFVTEFLGTGGNIYFYVNGISPPSAAPSVELSDGDLLEVDAVQDTTNWSDAYAWFERDGARVDSVTVYTGTQLSLSLYTSSWGAEPAVTTGESIRLQSMNLDGVGAMFGNPMAVVDGDIMNAVFSEAGTYYLSATDTANPPDIYFSSPLLEVRVADPLPEDENADITRADIIAYLYTYAGSAFGSEQKAPASNFTDVAPDAIYADAVGWAAGNGIISGYGDGTFGPDDKLTREQFAAILYRFANMYGVDTSAFADISAFTDASSISDWALPAVKWAVAAHLLTGKTDTYLAPSDSVTRADINITQMAIATAAA